MEVTHFVCQYTPSTYTNNIAFMRPVLIIEIVYRALQHADEIPISDINLTSD